MLPFINLAPLLFTLATTFGVVIHDMHIDRAARVAMTSASMTGSIKGVDGLDSLMGRTEHTHVERTSVSNSFSSALPKVQPPRNDEQRYVQNKKSYVSGGDDRTHLWPST